MVLVVPVSPVTRTPLRPAGGGTRVNVMISGVPRVTPAGSCGSTVMVGSGGVPAGAVPANKKIVPTAVRAGSVELKFAAVSCSGAADRSVAPYVMDFKMNSGGRFSTVTRMSSGTEPVTDTTVLSRVTVLDVVQAVGAKRIRVNPADPNAGIFPPPSTRTSTGIGTVGVPLKIRVNPRFAARPALESFNAKSMPAE